ncbi:TonB-dependent receptor [Myxococcota bacterium]|nr:TonB-dependent receptor [Myxococcota bacterium]
MSALLLLWSVAVVSAQEGWGGVQSPGEDPPEEAAPGITPPRLLTPLTLTWPGGPPYEPATVEWLLLINAEGVVEEATPLYGQEPFIERSEPLVLAARFEPARDGRVAIAVEVPFQLTFTPPPVGLRLRLMGPDGAPLAGEALLVGEERVVTDAAGQVELRERPPGPVTVRLETTAWLLAPVEVTLQDGALVELDLRVDAPTEEEAAVGVYRRRSPQAVVRTVSAEEVRTTPGTLGDPVRALVNLPGVVRTPFDSGWLLVRGGDPDQTAMLIDGVAVPLVYHLGGFSSVIHPALVDSIEFFPGGYGARYGRATAGAVDIQTKTVPSALKVEAGADLLYAGAFVQAPLGPKTGLAVAARRSYIDRVLARVLSEEQAAIAPRFIDGQVKLDREQVGLFWMGFRDEVEVPSDDDGDTALVNISTSRVHGRVELRPGESTLRLTPFVARDRRSLAYEDVLDERETLLLGGRAQLDTDETRPWAAQFGLDAVWTDLQLEVSGVKAPLTALSLDPYAQLRIGEARRVVLGLRLDTWAADAQRLKVGVSPRVQGFAPLPLPGLELVGHAGLNHQAPPMELLAAWPDGRYLDLERSVGGGAGLRWTGGLVSAELDGYWRRMDHLAVFEDDGSLVEGQGLAYGVESLLRFAWGPLSGWTTASWTRSLRRDEPGQAFSPHIYDQPLYALAVLAVDLPGQWSFAARGRAGSGYAWNRDDQTAYDLLTMTEEPLVLSPQGRLQPYRALDLKVAWALDARGVTGELYLDVQNVTNRRVAEPVITGVDDRDTLYGFGLPVLPVFGFKGGWGGVGA